MYRFKLFALTIWVGAASVAGCKAPQYLQGYKDVIDSSFMKQIALHLGGGEDSITDYKMFSARISEKLVETNTVGEYSLVNELSGKKTVDLYIKRNYNELYFYELSSINDQHYGIFLAATFATEGLYVKCVGLGPLYIGFISKGENSTKKFVTQKEYTIKKEKGSDRIRLKEQPSIPPMYWVYEYVQADNSHTLQLRFSQIIQRGKNKVSGMDKPLMYDVGTIFNDPDALRFSLVKDNK
ncbi:MAG: hypothetical protein KF746_27865 [Chitinophagaceae bacterium]|nr:hypothetical protein [Chitinophagaceae bacterium]